MNIYLTSEKNLKVNLKQLCEVMNSMTKNIKFNYMTSVSTKIPSGFIDYEVESKKLKKLNKKLDNLIIHITNREYENNFFYLSQDNLTVISFAHWEHYTNLPLENGIVFFISQLICDNIVSGLNHSESRGCLSDYLENKADIDRCMRMSYLCEDCVPEINKVIKKDKTKNIVFEDLKIILNALANTSRWDSSIFKVIGDNSIVNLTPSTFEDFVADYYRSVGAEVKQDVNLAGFQIDVLITEKTPSGEEVKSVIECKFYKDKIGNRIVNDYSRVVATITDSGLAQRGILVSYSGFTQDAFLTAKHSGIKLVSYKDLISHSKNVGKKVALPENVKTISTKKNIETNVPKSKYPEVFVVMPFSSEFDDVFFYGIRNSVNACNVACARIDKVEFVGDILQEIHSNINESKIIIAEVSIQNPNVFYEIGYAQALNKVIIMLTRDISKTPFDIRGFNHIIYNNIKDLEEKLTNRLKVLLVNLGNKQSSVDN